MDLEKILEGLSQEEKLALLERLVRGAGKEGIATGKIPSVEERLERLEHQVGVSTFAPGEGFRRMIGAYPWETCCGGRCGPGRRAGWW